MKNADLKNALFQQFENRIAIVRVKAQHYGEELAKDVEELCQAYGPEAVNGLHEEIGALLLPKAVARSVAAPSRTRPSRRNVRSKRRRTPSNGPTLKSQLLQIIPPIVDGILKTQEEFTSRDVVAAIAQDATNKLPIDTRLRDNISLFLGQQKKQLGLKAMPGSNGSNLIHYSRAPKKGKNRKAASFDPAPKKSGKSKSSIDWRREIPEMLSAHQGGLTLHELGEKLGHKLGFPVRLPSLGSSLRWLCESGSVVFHERSKKFTLP